jgi:glyoxylase-like metal-dependent hydrolase (beta-lactamase superfamily II)
MRPRHVVGPFHRLRGLVISNVFLLDGGRGDRWLIDTGHRLERSALLAGLRSSGLAPSDLTGVLLTHRHCDHAGNAGYLRRAFGVPVVAHALDAAVLARRAPKRRIGEGSRDRLAWALAQFENLTTTATPVDRELEDGDAVASLEVHHVPGHTEGSVFFRHAGTESLLSGDTLLAAFPPLTIEQGMALPHPAYSLDLEQALASLRAFHAAGHAYENLLAGHGRPILGGARGRAVEPLARAPT